MIDMHRLSRGGHGVKLIARMHLPQWVKIYLRIHSFCLNVGFNDSRSWAGDCTAQLRSCPVLLGI